MSIESDIEGRILVVDDNPLNLSVLVRQLQALGYLADTASRGLQALQLLIECDYVAILSDCEMPGMDGSQLAREIRRREQISAKPATPIIGCSSNNEPEDIKRCIAAGMNDYLLKPVTLDALKTKLDIWAPRNGVSLDEFKIDRTSAPSSLASEESSPVIDRQLLNQIMGGDEQTVIDLLGDFYQQH